MWTRKFFAWVKNKTQFSNICIPNYGNLQYVTIDIFFVLIKPIVGIENTKYKTIAQLAHFIQRLELTQITDTYTHIAMKLYIDGNIA